MMRIYNVANGTETAYYSVGYRTREEAMALLRIAIEHDPKAHVVVYERQSEVERLSAEQEQVKRERDAAVRDLRSHAVNGNTCAFCKNNGGCAERQKHLDSVASCWEWRGLCNGNRGGE